MASTQPALMTVEDLMALPDDGNRYELIEGVLVQVSPAARRHSRIEMRIGWRLMDFVEPRGLGEVHGADATFILRHDPPTTLSPDVSFITTERLPERTEDSEDDFFELAPDLAVEVISPSNRAREMSDRVLAFLDAGTRLIWLVEPRRRVVTVYTVDGVARVLRSGDELDGGDVLPGFRLPVADIFV